MKVMTYLPVNSLSENGEKALFYKDSTTGDVWTSYTQHPRKVPDFADFTKGYRTMQVLLKEGYELVSPYNQ